jgi:hypothetical protein
VTYVVYVPMWLVCFEPHRHIGQIAAVFNFYIHYYNMWTHENLSNKHLKLLIKKGSLTLGGNKKLKIFGLLTCASGKRMKKENRVFFVNELEAWENNYRPCGHCMRRENRKFRDNLSKNQVERGPA